MLAVHRLSICIVHCGGRHELLEKGDIIMRQLPGLQMVADLGMMLEEEGLNATDGQKKDARPEKDQVEKGAEKEESRPRVHEETSLSGGEGFRHLSEGDRLRMAIVLAVLAPAAGMSEESEIEMNYGWTPVLMSILIVVATGMITWPSRWWTGGKSMRPDEMPSHSMSFSREPQSMRGI